MKENKSWLRYMTAHPTAANLLMLIFLFLGFYTVRDLRRETFPDFAPTEIEITIKYPGATAEDVENSVCQRVEDSLDGVTDLEEVKSEARENQARMVAKMREDGDMNRFLSDVKTEVEAIDNFPDEVEKPIIKELGRQDMVVSVAVTGPMSVPHLKAFCEEVKDRMLRIPEISQVELHGFSDHQILIELPADTLKQYGLSIKEIADRLTVMSLDLPAGAIETSEADVVVRFAGESRTVPDFENLPIVAGKSGAELKLGDIARITDRFELDEEKIIFNGQRAGLLTVNKTKTEDALRIMDAVQAFVERERKASPPSVKFVITQNVSKIVRDRLTMLLKNGVQGFILVFLVMWLFFSLRFSFWVAMGLPVSFLGAVFAMNMIDFSLNMLTMVGLLLAIGLLMDDAIVISENVAAHLNMGKEPFDATVDGVSEVQTGVFSSFLTTLFVFGPAAFMIKGNIGKVLWVIPVILIVTLSISLVEAFLILPNHLSHSLAHAGQKKTNRLRLKLEDGLDWVRENILGRFVDWAIRWRYLFIGLVISAFVGTLAMPAGGFLKFRAFPDIDGDVLNARILLPQGTPLKRTEEIVKQVTDALERVNLELTPLQPDGQSLVQNVNVQFNRNIDAFEFGPHVATVSVDLLSAESRNARMDDITNRWRSETGDIPDLINISYKQPAIGPAGLPIDIRLLGSDLKQLKQASIELMNWLNSFAGVLDLTDDLRPGKKEIVIDLKPGALSLGLDSATVATQLRSAFYGIKASEVQVGPESYDIQVRLARSDQDSLADLENFYVTTKTGNLIPLRAVAHIKPARGYARIARVNSVRAVTIQGDLDTEIANSAEIIAATQKQFLPELKKRFPDIEVAMEGEAKESAKTMDSMKKAFVVGIFGIFLVLSFQFKSYLEPIIVMTAIPLALIGVFWGHIIMGYEMCMPSVLGFVSLAGVVVNDSILLVEFIRIKLREGKTIMEAASQASRLRFRAVLLTSLTTIVGLAPLLMERSLQAQVLIPLAISIVFGLMASTVLILVVIPTLYTILSDLGLTRKTDFHG